MLLHVLDNNFNRTTPLSFLRRLTTVWGICSLLTAGPKMYQKQMMDVHGANSTKNPVFPLQHICSPVQGMKNEESHLMHLERIASLLRADKLNTENAFRLQNMR